MFKDGQVNNDNFKDILLLPLAEDTEQSPDLETAIRPSYLVAAVKQSFFVIYIDHVSFILYNILWCAKNTLDYLTI